MLGALTVLVVGLLGPVALDVTGATGGVPTVAPAQAAEASPLLAPLRGWKPTLRPIFNDPGSARSRIIVRRIVQAINHAKPRSTIRIATYSFDRGDVVDALLRARKRGVRVQIVVNRETMSTTARDLQRRLGRNPRARNFVVDCAGRCRGAGDGGNQHIKIFSFTRTGGARDVIIGSSGNLTSKAVYRQWNDSWAVAYDPRLFDAWVRMFDQMKLQRQQGRRHITFSQDAVADPYSIWFERTTADALGRATSGDPVVRRLDDVGCRARKGYGVKGRTVVRIMTYAMYGARGRDIANAVARTKQRGCDVVVIGSVVSAEAIGIMQRAGIPVRMADWMFAERVAENEDGLTGWGPRFYAHYKAMMVNGTYQGRSTTSVWTGSENWSGISFANEEVVMHFTSPGYYKAYLAQFGTLWSGRATHVAGIEPTYGPPPA